MRFAVVFAITLSSGAWAADAFVGDWKLNPAESKSPDGRTVKDGRALIEPDNSGGYLQFSETVFAEGAPLRFTTRVQFDGTPGDVLLENHLMRFVSKRIDANAFEISLTDSDTGKIGKAIRASVDPQSHLLTMIWADGSGAPLRKLVYQKTAEGPVLEAGKTVEHSFGPGDTFEYRVNLRAGEYCQGKVDQKGGSINLASYGPDGARLHGYGGPGTGNKIFSLEASASGFYRIVLRSAASPATAYAITIDKIVPIGELPHGEAAREKFPSPRIAALRKSVESGDSNAVAAFWRDVEKHGTPLIEPIEDNHSDNLVTFLWRATGETHSVMIGWFPFAAAKPDDYQLIRLGTTDVWYRTLKIRKGARFVYQLSPNDPLVFEGDSGFQRLATSQADPLNPHHWFENPGSTKFEYQSMVEMPDAKPPACGSSRIAATVRYLANDGLNS